MKSVSHGKPCAGNPHARFEEGASASKTPRRNALLHPVSVSNFQCGGHDKLAVGSIITSATLSEAPPETRSMVATRLSR